jgi:hypothetical protein
MNASEKQQWEVEYYGVPVSKLHEMVREAYTRPHEVARSEVSFAVCLVQNGRGESNRDEIVRALHRAQWILVNKVQTA